MSSTDLQTQTTQALAPAEFGPRTFDEALKFSNYLADSDFVPKDYKGKPANCLIAMQWGAEVGLKPLQAIQNIAVINGRPALWGDSLIALARSHPACEYIVETDDGKAAYCKVKRRGEPEQVRSFSVDDAKAAGLAGKQGPWTQYPKRMRQMRARAFALRDIFPDALKGLPVAEEVLDTPTERHMGPVEIVTTPAALPDYDQAKFAHNLSGAWQKRVNEGGSPVDLLNMLKTRNTLTTEQEAHVLSLKPIVAAETPAQPEDDEAPWKD